MAIYPNKQNFRKLKSTLMLAFLILSLTPLTITALFFLNSHSKDLQEQSHSYLVSVRDTKQQQIIDYIKSKESEVMGFVRSELAYASGGRFYGLVNAFKQLGNDIEQARDNAQQRYIIGSGNQIQTTPKKESDNFAGSERYRLLHKRYHPAYVELLKRSDFDDILLVDIAGNVTYSTQKLNNYAANLLNTINRETNLGKAFSNIKQELNNNTKNKDYTPVIMSDFAIENGQLYAWFASPIIQQGYLHSYALLRLPITRITRIVNDLDKTSSASILLVGSDYSPRAQGISQKEINNSRQVIDDALNNQTVVSTYSSEKKERFIAAYAPVRTSSFNWALVAQIPENLAYARIHQLEKVFIVAMFIAIILVIVASHYLSNFITAPLLKLAWAAEKVSAGEINDDMFHTERNDEIGRLAISFKRMQRSIRDKIQTIKEQNQELEINLQVIQKQNDELHIADKLKDEFLATTSHELRTPLHGMIGIAETLISGENGHVPAPQKHQLNIIINSGLRLSNLVDDLLDYHKMRYGQLDIQKAGVNIFNATSLVLELSEHLLSNKHLRIINQIPCDIPLVLADPQRLEQVLYNLIGNAIKYTDEGKIVISASQVDDRIRVHVVDTGQGIPTEQLEHIFEPLIQAGQDTQRYRQGAGLGLSISRQLIELMGGTLYVSSQYLVGTTFSFSLPVVSKDDSDVVKAPLTSPHFVLPASGDAIELTNSPLPDNPDGHLILIVDDEPVNIHILDSFLRLEGYRTKSTLNGADAFKCIENEKPDLLLLDIMMPGISGYDVCEQLRAHYDHGQLPIIMLTALSQPEDRIKGFEAGANDYLTKPFNKQELSARIKAHLTASKAELRRIENRELQQELKRREIVEENLLKTQYQLLEQLDSAPEAIICIGNENRIRFSNEAAAKLFERTTEQLRRSRIDDLVPSKYLKQSQHHFCGEVEVFVANKKERMLADIMKLPEDSNITSMLIFNAIGKSSNDRIDNLETAIEALSSYAFEGDKTQLQALKKLGGDFIEIADKVADSNQDKQLIKRQLLVEAMTTALNYWELSTGTSKFTFAEKSNLWRVYLDRSTLQTRTLDKYMHVETLPKTPRWRTVISSIDFILSHCSENSNERDKLIKLRDQLQALLSL